MTVFCSSLVIWRCRLQVSAVEFGKYRGTFRFRAVEISNAPLFGSWEAGMHRSDVPLDACFELYDKPVDRPVERYWDHIYTWIPLSTVEVLNV